MNKQKLSKVMVLAATVALALPTIFLLGYYAFLYLTWEGEPHFIQANRCLNAGGVFQSDIERCWYAGQCEDEGGFWYPKESRCVFDR